MVPLEGPDQGHAPRTVIQEGFAYAARFSPDGRWVVYSVFAPAQDRGVYVRPFPGLGTRKQIADARGVPFWRKDGKEIVIADPRGVRSVRVDATGGELRFGAPELLFSGLRWPNGYNMSVNPFAVSRDGSRIYFVQAVEQPPDSNLIHILTGWAK